MSDPFELQKYAVAPEASVREATLALDRNGRGVALAVDGAGVLRGVISDGDLRRALLEGSGLEAPVSRIYGGSSGARRAPLTAPLGTEAAELLRLMKTHGVRQLPLLDEQGRVGGLAFQGEIQAEAPLAIRAVVMAGGFGKRLGSLTEDLPKPMLPIGGRPLLELLIGRLREAGVRQVTVTTHYKPEKIQEHFGDGARFGVQLDYVIEKEPLGTAGAVGLIEAGAEPVLVVNGDLLTRVDFRALLKFHQSEQAALSVGIRAYDVGVPYGVVETEGAAITGIREKPKLSFFINAGVYLLDPATSGLIPRGKRFDMTDLIDALISEGRRVAGFPIIEYWLDIGRSNDYEKALIDYGNGSA